MTLCIRIKMVMTNDYDYGNYDSGYDKDDDEMNINNK